MQRSLERRSDVQLGRRALKLAGMVASLLAMFLLDRPNARCATLVVSQGVAPESRGQILREVVDPCLGLRWHLVADSAHPSWPPRMLLVNENGRKDGRRSDGNRPAAAEIWPAEPSSPGNSGSADSGSAKDVSDGRGTRGRAVAVLVIYAGDPVIVDQDTGVLQARLKAVALESAAAGQRFRARLIVNCERRPGEDRAATGLDSVISVVATEAGRAVWKPDAPATMSATRPHIGEREQP